MEETPGFGLSVFTALFPVIIMGVAAIVDMAQQTVGFGDNALIVGIRFVGNSSTAMLISLLLAIFTMGIGRKNPNEIIDEFLFVVH